MIDAEHLHGSEDEVVARWRAHEFLRAGYELQAAWELALRRDVDLHAAVDLVRAGCPHETALRILL